MRKKHEHTHTAREEWSNEAALIQALRRWRLGSQYLCRITTVKEKWTDGRKISSVQRKNSENSRRSTQKSDALTKNINSISLGIFSIFYICSFLSASLHALTHCCPSTAVTKTRDSQVHGTDLNDVSVFNTMSYRSFWQWDRCVTLLLPRGVIADSITEPCLDSSLVRRFSAIYSLAA